MYIFGIGTIYMRLSIGHVRISRSTRPFGEGAAPVWARVSVVVAGLRTLLAEGGKEAKGATGEAKGAKGAEGARDPGEVNLGLPRRGNHQAKYRAR